MMKDARRTSQCRTAGGPHPVPSLQCSAQHTAAHPNQRSCRTAQRARHVEKNVQRFAHQSKTVIFRQWPTQAGVLTLPLWLSHGPSSGHHQSCAASEGPKGQQNNGVKNPGRKVGGRPDRTPERVPLKRGMITDRSEPNRAGAAQHAICKENGGPCGLSRGPDPFALGLSRALPCVCGKRTYASVQAHLGHPTARWRPSVRAGCPTMRHPARDKRPAPESLQLLRWQPPNCPPHGVFWSSVAISWFAVSTCSSLPRSSRQNTPGATAWLVTSAPLIVWME